MKILHHHIPKTGGTTLNTLLFRAYGDAFAGAKDIFPYVGELKRRGLLPDFPSIFEKYSAVAEHKYLLHVTPSPWKKVLILRDPLERVLSLYYDWMSLTPEDIDSTRLSGPDNPVNNSAVIKDKVRVQQMPLQEFIQSPLSKAAQYHYINGICRSLTDVPVNCSSVSADLRQWRQKLDINNPQELFEAAKEALKAFDYIAFQDNLDNHIKNIFSLLGLPVPAVPRLNNKEGKLQQIKKLGREVPEINKEIVESHQEADVWLYNYAKELYDSSRL